MSLANTLVALGMMLCLPAMTRFANKGKVSGSSSSLSSPPGAISADAVLDLWVSLVDALWLGGASPTTVCGTLPFWVLTCNALHVQLSSQALKACLLQPEPYPDCAM